jgi:cob(I)alamin adenosyltransferase
MNHGPRVLLFTGDGKGKTTAALGLAFRAGGHGLRSCVIQFIKGDSSVGEIAAAAVCGHIELIQCGRGFLPKPEEPQFAEHRAAAQAGWQQAREILASGRYALVVLDEACLAVARGLLTEQQVASGIAEAAPDTCVVLTGRGATPGLIAVADTVTEMVCRKHGLQAGIAAQKGIEW